MAHVQYNNEIDGHETDREIWVVVRKQEGERGREKEEYREREREREM